VIVHAGVFDCHERRVDDNAQCYKQVDEGIHDKQLDHVRELIPTRTALPAEQHVDTLGLNVFLQHAFLAKYACS